MTARSASPGLRPPTFADRKPRTGCCRGRASAVLADARVVFDSRGFDWPTASFLPVLRRARGLMFGLGLVAPQECRDNRRAAPDASRLVGAELDEHGVRERRPGGLRPFPELALGQRCARDA